MNICVVGTGYVGLVTGACLAEGGNRVVCVDTDKDKIAGLVNGIMPIYEPGLEEMVRRNIERSRLIFQTTVPDLEDFSAAFIAVGTPEDALTGAADMRYVQAAARDIANKMNGYTVVVIKSTVPPGTSLMVDTILGTLRDHTPATWDVVSNPEFLKEGDAIRDFQKPSRVAVGTSSEAAIEVMRSIYAPFLSSIGKFLLMSNESAELAKYANNGMLATRISFMNEISRTAEKVGANIDDIRAVVGADPRIGDKFLFAGAGWGGSCFFKDLSMLAGMMPPYFNGVVRAAIETNKAQKAWFAAKVFRALGKNIPEPKVAIWGITFKPGTDDVRDSPAIFLMEALRANSVNFCAYDPEASLSDVDCPYLAATDADVLVLVTEWPEFKQPDWERLASVMRRRIVVDGRNIWAKEEAETHNFQYSGVGR